MTESTTGSTQLRDELAPSWIDEITIESLLHPQDTTTRLREEAPLAWIPALGTWAATSWDLCKEIANDTENFEAVSSPLATRVFGDPNVTSAEGDLHTHLRNAVATPVSARAIRGQIESRMRPTAKGLIEKLRTQGGTAELLVDYFEPISVRSVADSYGFFDVETDTLRRWFHQLKTGSTNMARNPDGSFANPDGFALTDGAREEIREYLEGKAKEDTEDPNNVIARWIHAESTDGQTRSIDALVPSMLIVLLGGLQEPGHALGSTFFGLTTRPEQLQRVIADKTLLPKAISEGLRWMSPLYAGPARAAKHDLVLQGQQIHKGDIMRLVYGSANHDSKYYEHGELYDLDRYAHPHLAFGDGRHSCVGSALGPQIARVGLEELFAAFPNISVDPARPITSAGWPFHGPTALNVLFNDDAR
ncbi:cytochrome P450 [Subtercola lobariae]|uniref:Cytochrome P450 n=1 Tax=Subtercola lobariae TaxID=1588641 RepID=A0A917F220_9MICO|nr:cytochrome P450 [Subtercola lobariae]GGF35254.1 cytochrome P450 [Subtercola lobariae]